MVTHTPQKICILGLTHSGRVFRPSDWAERLAGVMSAFRPSGAHRGNHFSYSPWCVPSTHNGIKCVIVSEALRQHNVMAWDFCMNFAKDNELQTLNVEPVAHDKPGSLHAHTHTHAHHKPSSSASHHNASKRAPLVAPSLLTQAFA